MKPLIAAFAAVVLLAATADAQTARPGLLPNVWWSDVPVGQPITVQPMARVRLRVLPWWRRMPPVIRYCPAGGACQVPTAPACQGPGCNRWGRFSGEWGFGQPPQNDAAQ